MKIYVYRVGTQYDAGFIKDACKGHIVEEWNINSPSDARYLATHGSNYGNVSSKVSKLADLAYSLIYNQTSLNGGFIVTQREFDKLLEERQVHLELEKNEAIAQAIKRANEEITNARKKFREELSLQKREYEERLSSIHLAIDEMKRREDRLKAEHKKEIAAIIARMKEEARQQSEQQALERDRSLASLSGQHQQELRELRKKAHEELVNRGLWARTKLAMNLIFRKRIVDEA